MSKTRRTARPNDGLDFLADAINGLRSIGRGTVKASPQRLELHGLDFVSTAVKQLEEAAGDRDLRYALLHLAAGVELLMKSWLMKEHWALLFEKLDDANSSKLVSGKFRSATAEQCIQRLERVSRVSLSETARQELERLRDLRNQMIHYAMPFGEVELRALSAGVLSELIELILANCELQGAEERKLLAELQSALPRLEQYRARRREKVASELRRLGEDAFLCPACGERAVTLEDGRNECLVCLDAFHYCEVQDRHMTESLRLKPVRNVDFGRCPSCFELSFGRRWQGSDVMFCFSCHHRCAETALRVCGGCEEWFADDASDRCAPCRASLDGLV